MDLKLWIGIILTALAFVLWLAWLIRVQRQGASIGRMVFYRAVSAVMIVGAFTLTKHADELPLFSILRPSWLVDFGIICGIPILLLARRSHMRRTAIVEGRQ